MPVIDFRNTKQIQYQNQNIVEVWFQGEKLWEKVNNFVTDAPSRAGANNVAVWAIENLVVGKKYRVIVKYSTTNVVLLGNYDTANNIYQYLNEATGQNSLFFRRATEVDFTAERSSVIFRMFDITGGTPHPNKATLTIQEI